MFFNIEMLLTALGYGRSNFYNIDYRAVTRVNWVRVLEIRPAYLSFKLRNYAFFPLQILTLQHPMTQTYGPKHLHSFVFNSFTILKCMKYEKWFKL